MKTCFVCKEIDGKLYAEAKDIYDIFNELAAAREEIDALKEKLNCCEKGHSSVMDLKAELVDTREALKHAHKENEEMLHKLEAAENQIRDLKLKAEFQNGQIDAFQFCMITAAQVSKGIAD